MCKSLQLPFYVPGYGWIEDQFSWRVFLRHYEEMCQALERTRYQLVASGFQDHDEDGLEQAIESLVDLDI
jgi:hypothetical protein